MIFLLSSSTLLWNKLYLCINKAKVYLIKYILMKTIAFMLTLALLYSCGQGNREMLSEAHTDQSTMSVEEYGIGAIEMDASATTQKAAVSEVNTTAKIESINSQKKIVRSGNISIESKDLKKTKSYVDKLVTQIGAYYEQETATSGSTFKNYNLTVRIPSSHFDYFLTEIEKSDDKVTEKSIQAQDVSLQYYDLESRLKSKRTYLDRYQKMVASAKNVKELLEIEEQIRQLQEEIESTETTLRSLKDQVGYSTLHISLFNSNSLSASNNSGYWLKIKEAFSFGWELIANIIIGLIGIWPLLLLAVAAFFGWKKYRKNKKAKNA